MWAHDDYLDLLTADRDARMKVASAEEFLRETVENVSFDTIFIGNGNPLPDGPKFGGLWYFADSYRILVANFLTEPLYFINRAGAIEGVTMRSDNWEPGRPSVASFLAVQFIDPFRLGGGMAARGPNCTQLHNIVRRFLLPRIQLT